jgi:hypothetical protein
MVMDIFAKKPQAEIVPLVWYRMMVGHGDEVLVAAVSDTGRRMSTMGGVSVPIYSAITEDGRRTEVNELNIDRPGIGGLRATNLPPLDPEEIPAMVSRYAAAMEAEKRKEQEQQEADKRERLALPEKFPFLVPVSAGVSSGHAAGAKNLKRHLERAFKGVKFRVSSKSYAGGCSITVRWVDGPKMDDVQPILDLYSTRHFDGMQDLETIRDNNHSDVFGGAGYVFGTREQSPETQSVLMEWARRLWAAGDTWTAAGPENLAYRFFAQSSIPAGKHAADVRERESIGPGPGGMPSCAWEVLA